MTAEIMQHLKHCNHMQVKFKTRDTLTCFYNKVTLSLLGSHH